MSQDKPLTYEIVATGTGENTGKSVRASIESDPLLIGSGDTVGLKLEGPEIQSVHARVLLTGAGQVLLINLADSTTIRRNAETTPSFRPIEWEPGTPIQIGNYELKLDTVAKKQEPPIALDKSSVADMGGTVAFSEEDILKDYRVNKPLPSSISPREQTPPASNNTEDTEAVIVPDLPQETDADNAFRHTPRMPVTAYSPQMPPPAPILPGIQKNRFTPGGQLNATATLPKDWQQTGLLSAQAIIDPVKLAAGERVRIPISVRNHHDHPLQLRIHLAGLSQNEAELPANTLELAAGEISAFDIILNPNTPPVKPTINLQVRLHDKDHPDAALTLPLQLIFKDAPNITCWLEPTTVSDQEQTILSVQNHTQATATAFVAGHSAAKGLRIIPSQTQLEIAPGQVQEIPVQFTAAQKRRFRSTKQPFSITVQQGNRAPLDIPGTVRVRSRVSPLIVSLASILLVIAIAALVIVPRLGNGIPPAAISTEVIPATATKETVPLVVLTVATTVSPTIPPTASPTITKTATPIPPSLTPSMTPFDNPRSENCTAEIPSGWTPYTVVRGDRVYQLAIKYGSTVEEITAINCLTNPRLLQIGQVLLLPMQKDDP